MASAPDPCAEVLKRNFRKLKNGIDLKRTTLFDRLTDAKLINEREKQTIEGKVEPFARAGELLDVILQKDEVAIRTFLKALRVTHQKMYSEIREEILKEDPDCNLPEGLICMHVS
jgi:hypothetical protein